MSLAINVDRVSAILLDGGWHEVAFVGEGDNLKSTFNIDSYEFVKAEGLARQLRHGRGWSGVCPAGFRFVDPATQSEVYGPLTAIVAVRLT